MLSRSDYWRATALNSHNCVRLLKMEPEPVTFLWTYIKNITISFDLDNHLPNMRTVRTSALIKFVALKQAAREARLGGEPVQTTEDFSSDVLQQEIFTPFR